MKGSFGSMCELDVSRGPDYIGVRLECIARIPPSAIRRRERSGVVERSGLSRPADQPQPWKPRATRYRSVEPFRVAFNFTVFAFAKDFRIR